MSGKLQASVPASPGRWRPCTVSAWQQPNSETQSCRGCTRWQAFAFLSAEHIPWPNGHLDCFRQGRSTSGCVHICMVACYVHFAFLSVWPGCGGAGVLGVLPSLPQNLQQRERGREPRDRPGAGGRAPGSNPANLSWLHDLGQVTSALYPSPSFVI